MTAPLRGGNDCGCAAMIHHEPPQAAFIKGPQGPGSSVIRREIAARAPGEVERIALSVLRGV